MKFEAHKDFILSAMPYRAKDKNRSWAETLSSDWARVRHLRMSYKIMNYLTLIITVAIVGFILGRISVGTRNLNKNKVELEKMREEARQALTDRTKERKDKILYLMKGELEHLNELRACGVSDMSKGITSDNVEKLLGVSNSTALRYLNELEREGKRFCKD
ncbi:MAG: hypothetical protein COV70_04445 [Parcubacteria group bacterium CG11_big_fil_rev_8_21_14_0_20_39_22]|nr:MAG: hypothetical protein COV70_04445 [Parcubacteria group bacterium CG11_big_fil_rev_8_21_14_0_20_39_22]